VWAWVVWVRMLAFACVNLILLGCQKFRETLLQKTYEIIYIFTWKLNVNKQCQSKPGLGWVKEWALLIKLLINAGVERSAWGACY